VEPAAAQAADAGGNVTSLDEFLRKAANASAVGGAQRRHRHASLGGKPMIAISPRSVVLAAVHRHHRIGRRSAASSPASANMPARWTRHAVQLPRAIDHVEKIDVEAFARSTSAASARSGGENLMLTGDQNIIDLAYSVRWNIAIPTLHVPARRPDKTIREVAESAMRAVVARVSLDDAIGAQRSASNRTSNSDAADPDRYRAGVVIQGIAIRRRTRRGREPGVQGSVGGAAGRASYMNQARAYALQLTAKAQGEAAQFDKVYEQYRQAPEVTRRRMYYETMEQVLSKVDKTVVETGNVRPIWRCPKCSGATAARRPKRAAR
jgi:membrane protease subunit HflK